MGTDHSREALFMWSLKVDTNLMAPNEKILEIEISLGKRDSRGGGVGTERNFRDYGFLSKTQI